MIALVLSFAACRDGLEGGLRPFDSGRGPGNVDEQGLELDAGGAPGHTEKDTGVVSGPCGAATICGDCIYKIGCGWCPSSNSCIAGDQSGPSQGSCSGFSISSAVCGASSDDAGVESADGGDPRATCASGFR